MVFAGAAYTEKSTRYFLAGANLGECSVLTDVQVDLESLLVGANLHLWIHTIALAAISDRRKSTNGLWQVYASSSEAATGALARRSSPESSPGDCLGVPRTPSRLGCLGF
jgi:hypothetical protein